MLIKEKQQLEEKQQPEIPEEIFRAYDIRGIVDETLTEDIVFHIGKALGTRAVRNNESRFLVARDGRLSGQRLQNALIAGLATTGINVVNIGRVATPILYFANQFLKIPSAVMLTGSHNPVNYNGLKIILHDTALYGDGILSIRQQILDRDYLNQDYLDQEHKIMDLELIQDYINYICENISLNKNRKLKIVIDCGNGVAGNTAPLLYEKLGCEVIPLYCDVDGTFPNHHPDPGDPNNLQDLINKVKEVNADIGFGFDGDGDRLGIVDSKGKVIWPDRYLMLLAKDILAINSNANIIFDVKSTSDLEKFVLDLGGNPILWKTGHSLIKAKMKETGALLAGEMSGHVFIKDRWFGFDDALYAGARILEIISNLKIFKSSHDIFASLPEKISTPEIAINVTESKKFEIIEKLIDSGTLHSIAKKFITIDGIRVEFDEGWGLLRPSNTTPKLIARFEANNESILTKIQEIFRENLLAIEPSLTLPF